MSFDATLVSHCIVQESAPTGRTAYGVPIAWQPAQRRCRWKAVTVPASRHLHSKPLHLLPHVPRTELRIAEL
jgi:hypothetical protein